MSPCSFPATITTTPRAPPVTYRQVKISTHFLKCIYSYRSKHLSGNLIRENKVTSNKRNLHAGWNSLFCLSVCFTKFEKANRLPFTHSLKRLIMKTKQTWQLQRSLKNRGMKWKRIMNKNIKSTRYKIMGRTEKSIGWKVKMLMSYLQLMIFDQWNINTNTNGRS